MSSQRQILLRFAVEQKKKPGSLARLFDFRGVR
jgi:hypothetical protein